LREWYGSVNSWWRLFQSSYLVDSLLMKYYSVLNQADSISLVDFLDHYFRMTTLALVCLPGFCHFLSCRRHTERPDRDTTSGHSDLKPLGLAFLEPTSALQMGSSWLENTLSSAGNYVSILKSRLCTWELFCDRHELFCASLFAGLSSPLSENTNTRKVCTANCPNGAGWDRWDICRGIWDAWLVTDKPFGI